MPGLEASIGGGSRMETRTEGHGTGCIPFGSERPPVKRSVVLLVLTIALLALGSFVLIGLIQGDDTDQLEQNQPTETPAPSSTK